MPAVGSQKTNETIILLPEWALYFCADVHDGDDDEGDDFLRENANDNLLKMRVTVHYSGMMMITMVIVDKAMTALVKMTTMMTLVIHKRLNG